MKQTQRLGILSFVSSERISPNLYALSWFSTMPYLSVILGNFSPTRLVIDPTREIFLVILRDRNPKQDADRAVSVQPRELVRIYSCLHR